MSTAGSSSIPSIGRRDRGLRPARHASVARVLATAVLCLGTAAASVQPAVAENVICIRSAVVLRWAAPACPDLAGYRVWRSTTSGGPYVEITPHIITMPWHIDYTVRDGETYVYVVTARDFAGNESVPSPEYESLPVRIELFSPRADKDDADRDGLTDAEEDSLGTDPRSADSDNDGLSDGEEVFVTGTNPTAADSDGDGVDDGREVTEGTNPMDRTDLYDRCDVNRDGELDAMDVQLTVLQTLLDDAETGTECDIDGDGLVSAADLQRVVNAVLGVESGVLT